MIARPHAAMPRPGGGLRVNLPGGALALIEVFEWHELGRLSTAHVLRGEYRKEKHKLLLSRSLARFENQPPAQRA